MRKYLNTLPSDFASDNEKRSIEYGLSIAKVIDEDWFTSGRFSNKQKHITENRLYSKGEQNTDYKTMIEGKREGDKMNIKTHKIDYTKLLKVMPVFKDAVINAIDESLFKPRAEAIDITAVNTKKDYFSKIENDYETREIAQVISQNLGVNLIPEQAPKTRKEVDVKKIEWKPDIEIAQELAIENVLKHQEFETIKNNCDEDIFDIGYAVAKHYTNDVEGIKIKYVDPYYHGCSDFEMKNGKDIRYHFELKKGTISELSKLAGGLSKENLKKLRNRATGETDNRDDYDESIDGDRLIEYIQFVYLVPMSQIFKKHKKNGVTSLIDRTNDEVPYNPARKSRKLEIPYDSWFEGIYVHQDEIMIKWEEVNNQIEETINNPVCPYHVVAPRVKRLSERGVVRFDSQVDRAKPILDDLQRDWFKFQQLKMELRPNTVEIDIDAINNVMLNGSKIPANTILDLFFGRGLLLKNKYDEDGDVIEQAVKENPGGINNTALGFLSQEFSNNYERLRKLLGINELKDGTVRQSDRTPAKIQKILLASSNNNIAHIVRASFDLSLMFASSISLRLIDVLGSKNLKDMYMNIIGTKNVDLLDAITQIPMHEFGIYFDFKPDDEDRVSFEQSLITDLNSGRINSSQYNKARQIRNVKSAIKYLGITIEENEEKEQQRKIEAQKIQGDINAQSALVAERAKQQTETLKWNVRKQELLLQDEIEANKEKRTALIREKENEIKHQREMELESLKAQNTLNTINLQEEGKKKRIDQTSSNTSEIADQKINKKAPIDFENGAEEFLSQPLP